MTGPTAIEASRPSSCPGISSSIAAIAARSRLRPTARYGFSGLASQIAAVTGKSIETIRDFALSYSMTRSPTTSRLRP